MSYPMCKYCGALDIYADTGGTWICDDCFKKEQSSPIPVRKPHLPTAHSKVVRQRPCTKVRRKDESV